MLSAYLTAENTAYPIFMAPNFRKTARAASRHAWPCEACMTAMRLMDGAPVDGGRVLALRADACRGCWQTAASFLIPHSSFLIPQPSPNSAGEQPALSLPHRGCSAVAKPPLARRTRTWPQYRAGHGAEKLFQAATQRVAGPARRARRACGMPTDNAHQSGPAAPGPRAHASF